MRRTEEAARIIRTEVAQVLDRGPRRRPGRIKPLRLRLGRTDGTKPALGLNRPPLHRWVRGLRLYRETAAGQGGLLALLEHENCQAASAAVGGSVAVVRAPV